MLETLWLWGFFISRIILLDMLDIHIESMLCFVRLKGKEE